ncbi:hypothetical protein CEXT_159801 [Caerostris extrusa]|uniref:Uncharacterized protein n=1 Tax=Caerostris extrusa TaxID=172846 RepID=A0AAV4TTA7_CAEEX|nr:hypothetical protein CEXT_159801 [Caerostris extrusa]
MKLCRSPNKQREMQGDREQLNGTRTSFPVICSSVNGISFPHRRTDQWMFVFPPRSQPLITAQDEQREKEMAHNLHNYIWSLEFRVICSSVNGISIPHRRTDQWMFVFPPRSQSLITEQDEQRKKRRRTCIIPSGVWNSESIHERTTDLRNEIVQTSEHAERDGGREGEQLNGTRTSFPVIRSSVNGISFPHR